MMVRTLSLSLSLLQPRFDLGDAPRTKHPLKDQRIVRAALGGFSGR